MRLSIIALAIVSCGCNESLVDPSAILTCPPPAGAPLTIQCLPSDSNLRCSLVFPFTSPACDVTTRATWTVSNPAIAAVTLGNVTVLGHGEIDITARYDGSFAEPWTALVDPHNPPRQISGFFGTVTENDGTTAIGDVLAEVLDGYSAGRSARSGQSGLYTVSHVITKEPFTVRASKAGYVPLTTTFEIDPAGFSVLTFRDRVP